MKRRLLGILVAAAMIICAIPLTASAESASVFIAGSRVFDDESKLKSEGVFTSADISSIKEGTVSVQLYDEQGQEIYTAEDVDKVVFTLSNAKIDGQDTEGICCYNVREVEILLVGDNSINLKSVGYGAYGVFGSNFSFKGSGSLNISATGLYGNAAYAGNMLFADSVKVRLEGSSMGLMNDGVTSFNLKSGGRVEICNLLTGQKQLDFDTAFLTMSFDIADDNKIITPANATVFSDSDLGYCYIVDANNNPATTVVVESSSAPTPTPTEVPVGVPTGDSNNIALFSLLAVLGLAGAGFVYKRREN